MKNGNFQPPMAAARTTLLILSLLSPFVAIAQDARVTENILSIPVVTVGDRLFNLDLVVIEGSNPVELEVSNAVELDQADTTGSSSFDGITLSVPRILFGPDIYRVDLTLISESPVRFRVAGAALVKETLPPVACIRPDIDPSNGADNPPVIAGAIVPVNEIYDGGPGPDGIPSIESPKFTNDFFQNELSGDDLVIGVKIGDDIRAYPHNILNWHEVLNDRFSFGSATLSYCPLTGSAMLWKAIAGEIGNETFGVSGLLYNSNLILYDRRTGSLWSQMLERSIVGPEVLRIPERLQVVETTWDTWQDMYPQTILLAEDTEVQRPYNVYPYGSFREDNSLLFPSNNQNDNRLHRKERVLGINVNTSSKVYPISGFASNVEVINDVVGDMQIVAAGSSSINFGVAYNRELEDCTLLSFQPVQDNLPVVMLDNEGTAWDVFGNAVSGPRTGQALQKTNSFISYWYAWTAFFDGVEIHQ